MRKIGILANKGGVSKTTTACQLLVKSMQDFRRPVLLDLDAQQGALHWAQIRGAEVPPVVALNGDVSDDIEHLRRSGCDLLIADGAPGSIQLAEEAAALMDLVVIPLCASAQDLNSTIYTATLCKQLGVPYLLVLTNALTNEKRADEVRDGLLSINQPLASTIIRRRTAYVDAMNLGRGVTELGGKRMAVAAQEIDALYAEVMEALDHG